MSLFDLQHETTPMQRILRILLYAAGIAFLVTMVMSPHYALAQDGGTIETTAFIEYLLSILGTVLTAGLMWLIRQGASALGISKEAKIVQELQPMVKEAVAYGQRKAKSLANESSLTKIDVENEAVATAVNHILSQAPSWLKKAGITPAMVEGWVESLLDTPERDKAAALKAKADAA